MYIYLYLFLYKFLFINIIHCLIEQQPIFTSQPADVGPLFSGTRGILQCTASGTPTVQYRWLKNGQSLTNRSSSNGGVYLISQADRVKDVGYYQCIAENRLGSVLSNKAHLTVAYMDQLKVQYPVEIRVKLGRAAVIKLPKMYEAYPEPTIEWFAGGALIEPNAKFAITKDFNLVVLRCDKADEKSYYVEVSSIHTGARIRSREIRLYVIDVNSFLDDNEDGFNGNNNNLNDDYLGSNNLNSNEDIDLEFVVKPSDTIAKLNDNLVKFDCIVNSRKQALDQLEINWYKDAQLIDFIKTKYHLSSRSLEIISVTDQDAGVYTCSAKYTNLANNNLNLYSSYDQNINNNNIISINASAKLDVYIKPTFKNQPESLIETDFGKTVQIKCDGISNPPANITWYKNAELIDFEKLTNIQQADSGTKLIINNISIKDQAIYQCFLSNEAGHISASTLIKIISFAPKFTELVHNRTVYSDSNVEMSCGKVDGSPKPKITWTRIDSFSETTESNEMSLSEDFNNNDLHELGPGLTMNQNQELSIRNINLKHQGWYKCEASNILGKISASMFLQVKKKTEIIEPPMNISVTKGQSALFKCTVSKEDDIDVELKWKFNDLVLDLNAQYSDSYESYSQESNLKLYKNGTLQIIEAKNTDIGTYKCIVNSLNNAQAGNDSKTAYLNVVELPYAPVNLNANLNQFEKRSINLTWQSSFDGNSPILKYIIHAKINSFDQSLIQYDQSSSMYDWFVIKDNVLINPNFYQLQFQNQQQQQQTTYWSIINDLKPAFIYEFRVSAVNGIGEGMPSRPSNNITIPEEVPSQAPLNIQAYSINSRTITIQWQHPPIITWNGRLKGYQIAYSLSYPNSSWKYLQIEDYTQTNANLTDLIVWETYLIKICAFNAKGYGKYSNPSIRIRTKEGIPIRAPLNFKADSINSTCIKMSWNEPPAQFVNGLIQGYKLQFYENNQTDSKQIRAIYINNQTLQNNLQGSSQFNYQMCNLSKYTLYTLSLLCFTSSGDGPLTQPIQLKTLEDVPGEVSDILFNNVYDTSVDIEWRPPQQPNGRILSYVISYKPAQNSSKFEHIILDSSQLNFTIKNLKSSTDYIIGLRAKTQAGDGVQKLLQIKSGVPPELPEPPKAIVLRTIGQTFVELEFIPGYNGKTSINKWIVEALIVFDFKYNGSKWHVVYEKSNAPNATKLIVDNLKPFTNYTLRMFAKNVKGVSKPSQSTEVFQTLADVPSYTPEYLSARLENLYVNTSLPNNINILIKWTPIPTSKWNGIPLGYVLFINECLTNSSQKIEIKFNKFKQTSYLLKNLGAFKCYKIAVSAWNSVGLGPKTDEANILILNRTSQSIPSNYTYNVNLYTINSSSIRISWSALNKQYSNGILIGYMIKYQPIEVMNKNDTDVINFYDYEDQNELNQDNDLNFISSYKIKEYFFRLSTLNENYESYEFILGDLLSFTTYKIEISACTRAGCGQSSLPVSIKTLEYLSSRPIDLNFPYVNLTSVKLEWKPPRYPNGVLSSYRIRYILKKNLYQAATSWSYLYLKLNKTNLNKNFYEIEINGLMKMEYYIFEISANNTSKMGWGESGKTIVYTIDNLSRLRPDQPSRPTISKSSIKSNELTISWTTNSDNYSPIRHFTIQLAEFLNEEKSNQNKSDWKTVYLYKCANSNLNNNYRLTIKGKDKLNRFIIKPNGVYYKFRIASTNDVGTSEFSLESNLIKTKPDLPKLNLFSLNAKPLDSTRVLLDWYELIKPEDNLTKFKLVYRLVQEEIESILSNELIIDYRNTTKILNDNTTSINDALNELELEKNDNLNLININHHFYELKTNNLDKYGKYEFEICALNQVGVSLKCAKTKYLIYIEDRLPIFNKSIVKSVKSLSSTEINVTWSRPNDEVINGKLYAYKLVYINNDFLDLNKLSLISFQDREDLLEDNNDFINVVIIEPEQNSVILNNLKPYKNYSVLIQLVNQAGESVLPIKNINLFDESIRAQTFESVPSQPSKIVFSYIGFSYLNLTFYKPNEPNGVILAYELWYENMPTNSLTTRIIRQEITTNLDSQSQTLFITNLEPMVYYKFKIRCKTNIDWGPYLEKSAYTGPKLKKNYQKMLELSKPELDGFKEAPLAPSKPVYTSLNETHSLLEWKSYTNDFEFFIVEIKFISLSENNQVVSSTGSNLTKLDYELFSYTNTTSLYINKLDKKLGQNLAQKSQQSNYLCLFRVFSFNSVSISEPSPNSELIHINKLTSQTLASSINKDLSSNQQLFYLNWWFLVIIALSSVTVLIIIILIMLLRGKNKKFLQKKAQKEQLQQKMNTIKLMKMNGTNPNQANPDLSQDGSDNMNANSIYLAGSNQQLILTNTTNTLSRASYANGINNTNNNQITLYEIRKSKRGNASNYNTGTIKTATYVSPNGTLSRINIIDSNQNDFTDSTNGTLLKQQQINGLNNPRTLGNLIGLNNLGSNGMAQPNDYCTSKVGALLINNENGIIKSIKNGSNNHYLMPLNKSDSDEQLEGNGSKQHLYFQHMGASYGQINGNTNMNFNYSSSDENEANLLNNNNFNQTTQTYMSKKQIYTTNSFGRQTLNPNLTTTTQNIPNNLPPPPPALLTSSIINTENDPSNNFDERRANFNYTSTKSRIKPFNTYFDHQQVLQMQQQQNPQNQSQPMYHTHQPTLIVDSSPPPAPPPPPPPPVLSLNHNSKLRQSAKSPYIQKKPPLNLPIQKNQQPNIKAALSNTVEAISALTTAATGNQNVLYATNTIKLNENCYMSVNKNINSSSSKNDLEKNDNNTTNNASFNLSGDRVVMNNVAGSRKPLAGGYSFF